MATPYIEGYLPFVMYYGLNTQKNVSIAGSATFDASGSTGTFKTSTGTNTIGGNLAMATGKSITPSATGGVVPSTAPTGVANLPNPAATTGTDTTPANGTQWVTSIYIPFNMTITNINYLIGSVGGTDKVYGVLYDSTGAVLANTSLTGGGATVGTAANIQTLALTATYAAKGPGLYFVGISINGTTSRIRTVAAHTQAGIWANSVAQTHGTVAAITAPSSFTADKGPYVFLN